ncbi:2-isopropylmalate synthase [Colletotrichum sp. SAR11_239]|nr:2-isopropylmalate synthase [Colletotrichum sp. SAR11_239]
MRRLESELPVYQSHRADLVADRSIHRLSSAAAAIYFLESIPHENRTHLRRIILDEKDEAVSNPECYARGLIPFTEALKTINIDFDLNDYKEHAIGEGRGVKAVSYIEFKPAGSKQAVWGVGIHQDVVHSFLIAFLSAASNFVASRPASSLVIPAAASKENDIPSVISVLEEKANGI